MKYSLFHDLPPYILREFVHYILHLVLHLASCITSCILHLVLHVSPDTPLTFPPSNTTILIHLPPPSPHPLYSTHSFPPLYPSYLRSGDLLWQIRCLFSPPLPFPLSPSTINLIHLSPPYLVPYTPLIP